MRKMVIIAAGVAVLGAPVCVCATLPVLLWEQTFGRQAYFRGFDGATVADVDRDGFDEVLIAAPDGKCYVWRCDGKPYAGFPKEVHRPGIFFQSTPAVGDIDGDRGFEVVIGARGEASDGALYAWHHDGSPVDGFPIDKIYIDHTVALADINNDGALDIIATERCYPTGKVHVFDGRGRELPGWPKPLPYTPTGAAAVGDIDGDKKKEVLVASRNAAWPEGLNALFAWNDDGTRVPGFPFVFPYGVGMSRGAAALADFDNDGGLEIACGLLGDPGAVYLLEGDGSVMPGWPQSVNGIMATPTVADIDVDGYFDIIVTGYNYGPMYVYNHDGSPVPGFPVGPASADNAAAADIDNDGRFEILHDVREGTSIVAYNHDGSNATGFPLQTKGNTFYNCPVVWDIDRDGNLELIVVSFGEETGYVSVYRVGGDVHSPVWPMHKHDARHTSCYDTELGVGIVLDYFCARAEGGAVLVRWATAGEYNHAGFNLYRALAAGGGAKARLNASLITGKSPYRYLDREVERGEEYKYWLVAVELSGAKESYGPISCLAGGQHKTSFALAQNRPNPARSSTTVAFSVPAACDAAITVYDVAGRKVAAPFAGQAKAGENELAVDVSTLAPGVYTYRLEAGGATAAKRMVVVR
jgi:hypothetical protein